MRAALLALALLGCGKRADSPDRCERAFEQSAKATAELSRSLGLAEPEPATAEDKQRFLALCSKLSDEALGCVTDLERAKSPRCAEIMEQAMASAVEQAPSTPPAPIVWETVPFDHDRATASVPKGWIHDTFVGDVYSPPEDAGYGRFTRYQVGSACGGSCEPQPAATWAKRFADNEVARLQASGEILKDVPVGDTGRIVGARVRHGRQEVTHVVVGQWRDGGELYFVCQAEIDDRSAGLVGTFETACSAMQGTSFSARD